MAGLRGISMAAGPPAWLAVTVLVLGGCSVNTYKPAVEKFATATAKASDGYVAIQEAVVALHVEKLKQQAVAGERSGVLVTEATGSSKGECVASAGSCRLVLAQKGKADEPLAPDMPEIRLLLAGVATYAADLQAIVNSDAADQVNGNLAAAGGSIAKLATDVRGLTASGAAAPNPDPVALIQPAASLIGWLAGEYINLIQVRALREATTNADGTVAAAAALLDKLAGYGRTGQLAELQRKYKASKDAYENARADRAKLETLMADAARLDAALRAPMVGLFVDMATAHHKLTQALDGGPVTLAAALEAIQQFVAKAQALHDLVEALRAAAKPAAKS